MFDLDGFIQACRRFVGEPHGAKQVLELMRAAIGDAAALQAAIPPLREGENVLTAPLYRSAELTVLNATLRPGLVSIPHDHHMWAVIGIYDGEEANTFYRRAGERLEVANQRTIHAGEAILLGPEVIHAIENPLDRPTMGLHVYGGDLLGADRTMWDPATGLARAYDTPEFNRLSRDLAVARKAERAAATA